ncbi:acyl-CoA dehydrogenase family protein [Blastochloris viridis]|nr:acyl-CoA dehydrogenase family protein [Blastochloris viridis]BAR99438.1 butyryl-CoA dehydrogenase [Blastochloris viridis]
MSAQTFVRQVVAPVAAAADEREEFPVDVFRAAGRFGVFGAGFPSEYGGLALGWAVYTGLIREIAQACASTAMSAVAHATLAMLPIFLGGSERLKQRLLPALIGGEAIAAFAMTEAGSGSDIAAIATTATDAGEHFLLNGSKVFITNANVADVAVVVAKTAPAAGILGLSLLAVERGTPGFQATGRRERKLGMRASDTGELVFTDALVPKDNLIGRRNGGFAILQRTLPAARLDMAAIAIGISERARDLCVDHAVGRRQFGKPIGRFQLVQQMLADMETSIDAASLLLARGLELRERGLPLAKAASEAKLFASEMAVEITRNAIQVHGASGYSRDLPLERLYRDAKLTEIGDGTSEIQRLIIADEMIKERLARIPGR